MMPQCRWPRCSGRLPSATLICPCINRCGCIARPPLPLPRLQVAAAVFLGVVVAARFRVGNLPSEAQETHGLALIFLSSAVMMWGHELAESGWGSVRAVLVLALKFGAATCPLFSLFSQEMFNVGVVEGSPQGGGLT